VGHTERGQFSEGPLTQPIAPDAPRSAHNGGKEPVRRLKRQRAFAIGGQLEDGAARGAEGGLSHWAVVLASRFYRHQP